MPTLTLSIFARDDDLAVDTDSQCAFIFVYYCGDEKPVAYQVDEHYTTAAWCADLDKALYRCDDAAEIQADVYIYTQGNEPAVHSVDDLEGDEAWDVLQDQRVVFTLDPGVTVRHKLVNYSVAIEQMETYREELNGKSAFHFVANSRRLTMRANRNYRISDCSFKLWLEENGLTLEGPANSAADRTLMTC